MLNDKILELQEKKKRLHMTYEVISRLSGVPLSTVQKVLGGKIASPRPDTIAALEEVLSKTQHGSSLPRQEVSIGNQDFAAIVENGYFYIDKTDFIKRWWESADIVTLITRPRRFGKTLNLSMLDYFFSNRHQNSDILFKDLSIRKYDQYQNLQGQYPVLFMSFASVKGNDYETARQQIVQEIVGLYRNNNYLIGADFVTEMDKRFWNMVGYDMTDATAAASVKFLCELMTKYYGRKVLIFLDEYDTPIQESYLEGFWDKMTGFVRNLFNSTFKTNPYLERAILTGITRISKESIFSDLNNLKVDTVTATKYATDFGFTESEVKAALLNYDLDTDFDNVKLWYDGFRIGNVADIYNPWSVTQYLDTGILDNYWANTSENSLVEKLIREGGADIKKSMEILLNGKSIESLIDDEIVYNLIDKNESGVYSLLLAAGYLKIDSTVNETGVRKKYMLSLTNLEVKHTFEDMIKRWFESDEIKYNDFVKALLMNDVKYMNRFMSEIAINTFSFFDVGSRGTGKSEPEKFYHGFILGLMVDLAGKYHISSNRESGFGRYDVCLEPLNKDEPAYIFEFKVRDNDDEKSLEATVQKALLQIEEKDYDTDLISRGVKKENIYHYGFAFDGKEVLIG